MVLACLLSGAASTAGSPGAGSTTGSCWAMAAPAIRLSASTPVVTRRNFIVVRSIQLPLCLLPDGNGQTVG